MQDFTIEELKMIVDALDFYRYEKHITDNVDEYIACKNVMDKMYLELENQRGKNKMKGNE